MNKHLRNITPKTTVKLDEPGRLSELDWPKIISRTFYNLAVPYCIDI